MVLSVPRKLIPRKGSNMFACFVIFLGLSVLVILEDPAERRKMARLGLTAIIVTPIVVIAIICLK